MTCSSDYENCKKKTDMIMRRVRLGIYLLQNLFRLVVLSTCLELKTRSNSEFYECTIRVHRHNLKISDRRQTRIIDGACDHSPTIVELFLIHIA